MSIQPPPAARLAQRRSQVLDLLGEDVLVLPAAPVRYRSRDTEYPYRPDSELFYLTGVTEPEAVAVLRGGEDPTFTLFVRPRDQTAELWAGPRLGVEGAQERFGADVVHPVTALDQHLPALLAGARRLYARLGVTSTTDAVVTRALGQARARGARLGTGPRGVMDPGEILDDIRLVKDADEIEAIRRACAASVEGHRAGARVLAPGVGEWEVAAEVDAAFRRAGGLGPAFETIVGSGPNACVLHYVANARTAEAGDLVLVDAGAEVDLYGGDITRTLPASGRFTPEQRAVYEVVDAARQAALAAARPGATIGAVHGAAVEVLSAGLGDLGVRGGGESAELQEPYKPFFPHQTSHWLGLDVHDVGDYTVGGASRVLEPGMVFTVEPGLYFPRHLEAAGSFQGIGIRIEDDVLITQDGAENLTRALPTSPDEVEALVGEGL